MHMFNFQIPTATTSTPVSVNDNPLSAGSSSVGNGSLRAYNPTSPQDVATLLIPHNWRPEAMWSIKRKCLTDSARNEVVRSLVNMLFTIAIKPSRSQCNDLARKLF